MVEDQEQQDKDYLVEELTPTLHQESAGDFAATMETILSGRNFARADCILHTGSRRHGVFTADTNAVEEERPGVADDPSVLGNTPGGHQHDQTDEHDGGVLDQTPATTNPVTNDTDQDLTDNDTANFQIINSVDPGLAANLVRVPAVRETLLEQRLQVADGEQDVAFETKTSTGKNHVAEIKADGSKRIVLEHRPEGTKLAGGFLAIDLAHELDSLHDGKIGPVDTVLIITVVGLQDVSENLPLVLCHLQRNVLHRRVGARDIGTVGRVGGIVNDFSVTSHCCSVEIRTGLRSERVDLGDREKGEEKPKTKGDRGGRRKRLL